MVRMLPFDRSQRMHFFWRVSQANPVWQLHTLLSVLVRVATNPPLAVQAAQTGVSAAAFQKNCEQVVIPHFAIGAVAQATQALVVVSQKKPEMQRQLPLMARG
jgi:hypothetical protein